MKKGITINGKTLLSDKKLLSQILSDEIKSRCAMRVGIFYYL